MRDKNIRRMRHVAQLKAKRVFDTRGTNRDSILQSKAEGRTYKQINIDGQKFFVRLFTKQNRKES